MLTDGQRPDLFISFFGWYEDPHAIHIAMEYIAQGDLGQYIKDNKEKAKSDVKEITTQVLRGLVVLHEKQICHRDLKPQVMDPSIGMQPILIDLKNILIACTSPVQVKITDFGISKRALETSLRTNCGTTAYRAPEQLGLLPKHMKPGRSYTNAVDLWALGVVVHEIFTSETVFRENFEESQLSARNQSSTMDSAPAAIDMDLLYRYRRDSELFPVLGLQSHGVSVEWQVFVKQLMAVDPRIRLTAVDALSKISDIEIDPRSLRYRLSLLPVAVQNEKLKKYLACSMDYTIALLGGLVGPNKSPRNGNPLTRTVIPPEPATVDIDLALLRMAASYGWIDLIQVMLDRGTDINAKSSGFTNLSTLQPYKNPVAIHGQVAQQYLLTPLEAAATGGHLDAVRLVISNGAYVNMEAGEEGGVTALEVATWGGHLDVIGLLFIRGA